MQSANMQVKGCVMLREIVTDVAFNQNVNNSGEL